MEPVDATVVGAGPNGLAAAIVLARAGYSVRVIEMRETVGGGARTGELTLPGFGHDVCSAVHPLAVTSPFFRTLPLAEHGLSWVHPSAPLAHPLDGDDAVILERCIEATAAGLGPDGDAYQRLMEPFVTQWTELTEQILGPLRPPRHPLLLARFALKALQPARSLAERSFRSARARALFAGCAAHSMASLRRPVTAAFGLLLAAAGHAVGWPIARGGSQAIVDALASYLRTLGGEIVVGVPVTCIEQLGRTRVVLLDVSPKSMLAIAGARLSASYRGRIARFRYGPGTFKVDYALAAPAPWSAPECSRAATVHVGGTLAEISASEEAAARGQHPDRPFVLVAQPSRFDPTRAPEGKHTLWAYCHAPPGSREDLSQRIDAQISRFAPGFRDTILKKHILTPDAFERYNPNYVGGDIGAGAHDGLQALLRPAPRLIPYATSAEGIYLCSASTPPGAGVHGMCGYFAARAAIRRLERR